MASSALQTLHGSTTNPPQSSAFQAWRQAALCRNARVRQAQPATEKHGPCLCADAWLPWHKLSTSSNKMRTASRTASLGQWRQPGWCHTGSRRCASCYGMGRPIPLQVLVWSIGKLRPRGVLLKVHILFHRPLLPHLPAGPRPAEASVHRGAQHLPPSYGVVM